MNLNRLDHFLDKNSKYLYRLEANTFVVESKQIMYMDTPKAAGTSIKMALCHLSVDGFVPPNDSKSQETVAEMFVHDRSLNPLWPVTRFSKKAQQDILFSDHWKRFCVVRDPYERIFSAWFSKVLLRQPGYIEKLPGYNLPVKFSRVQDIYSAFEEFIMYLARMGCNSDPHWDAQTNLLFHGDIRWDIVFRFESLQQELLDNSEFFGGYHLILDQLNVSGFIPDWSRISENVLNLIRDLYHRDFEVYRYADAPSTVPDPNVSLPTNYVNAVIGRNLRIMQLFSKIKEHELESGRSHEKILFLDATTTDLTKSLERTTKQLEKTTKDLEHTTKDLEHTTKDLERTTKELEYLTADLHELVNSNSWRLTAPLRKLRNAFRYPHK